MVLDGVIFRGQAKGIPAYGIQHIVSLEPALSRHHVQRGIGAGMAHMQSLSRGIGELNESVIFGLVRTVYRMENAGLLPLFLPLRLHGLVFIFHIHSTFP